MKVKEWLRKKIKLIKEMKENPIDNIIELLPSAIVVVMYVIHLINYVVFIVRGGYKNQLKQTSFLDLDGILNSFTTGEMNTFLEKIDTSILWGLILLEMGIVVYSIIKNREKKKIIVGDVIIIAILIGIYLMPRYVLGNILAYVKLSTIQFIFAIYLFLVLVAGGILFYFVYKSTYRFVLKEVMLAGAISYFMIPFFFLILKNILQIISAGIAIVAFLIIAVIVFGFLKIFTSDGEGSEGAIRTRDESYEKRQKVKPLDINKPDDNMWVVPSGVMVHKVHGYMHDYIESSTWMGSSEICSLADLQKGKFLIYDSKGRRLGENDLTWKAK